MNHAPFIWASYAIGTIVLLWCALAPLMRKRAVLSDIQKLGQIKEINRDSDT